MKAGLGEDCWGYVSTCQDWKVVTDVDVELVDVLYWLGFPNGYQHILHRHFLDDSFQFIQHTSCNKREQPPLC